MNLPPGYISLSETARRLYVSRQWLYQHYIARAGLPVHRFPNGVSAVYVEALEQWKVSYQPLKIGRPVEGSKTRIEQIVSVMATIPNRLWTATQLKKYTGLSTSTLYYTLNQLESRGVVKIILNHPDMGLFARSVGLYRYIGE